MSKVEISYSRLGSVIIVAFDRVGTKYCVASPPLETEDYSEIFNIFALRAPENSVVGQKIKIDQDASKLIWKDLIDLGYKRVHDLESVFNQRILDISLRAFKVRHKKTGSYSKGTQNGGSFNWSKKGKTWNVLSHLKAHFSSMKKQNPDMPDYKDCEVVELGERRAIDIKDFKDLVEK